MGTNWYAHARIYYMSFTAIAEVPIGGTAFAAFLYKDTSQLACVPAVLYTGMERYSNTARVSKNPDDC